MGRTSPPNARRFATVDRARTAANETLTTSCVRGRRYRNGSATKSSYGFPAVQHFRHDYLGSAKHAAAPLEVGNRFWRTRARVGRCGLGLDWNLDNPGGHLLWHRLAGDRLRTGV